MFPKLSSLSPLSLPVRRLAAGAALFAACGLAVAQSPNAGGAPGQPGAPGATDGSAGAAGGVDRAALQEFAASKAGARAARDEAKLEPVPLCDGCARVTSVRSETRRIAGNNLGPSGTRRRTVWITAVRLPDGGGRSFEAAADPGFKVDEVVRVEGRALAKLR